MNLQIKEEEKNGLGHELNDDARTKWPDHFLLFI
jgi:hypothetical protein